ncbi:hypothetical protein RI054_16g76120 [Pseudoscourfieldia marina]
MVVRHSLFCLLNLYFVHTSAFLSTGAGLTPPKRRVPYSASKLHTKGTTLHGKVCKHLPFVSKFTPDRLAVIHKKAQKWDREIFSMVDVGISRREARHERFRVFNVVKEACPYTIERVGAGYGEGKMLCGIDDILKASPTVLSLGSDGDYTFEESLLENFPQALVHTYDCTGDFEYSGMHKRKVMFHRQCLGSKAHRNALGWNFITYDNLLEQLGRPYIALLKMDIEGYEYEVLPSVLEVEDAAMPLQIAVEVHYATSMKELSWSYKNLKNTRGDRIRGGKSIAELALLHMLMLRKGYILISREDNCSTCSELVYMKIFCSE